MNLMGSQWRDANTGVICSKHFPAFGYIPVKEILEVFFEKKANYIIFMLIFVCAAVIVILPLSAVNSSQQSSKGQPQQLGHVTDFCKSEILLRH